MNKQSYLIESLKPLILVSCIVLTFQPSIADTASKDMLNALSEEASNTKMANKQNANKVTVDPTESAELENKPSAEELSAKIEDQLRRVLGKDSDSSVAAKKNTEAELEKIVSSSLLEGVKMDDIRSAVSDAMAEIKSDKKSKEAIAPERITEADKAFSKLTVKKPPAPKSDEKSTVSAKSAPSTSSISGPLPKTVTVQAGESLYKIALRVYGDGDKYLKLYEANQEVLKDPNLLLEGQVLNVP